MIKGIVDCAEDEDGVRSLRRRLTSENQYHQLPISDPNLENGGGEIFFIPDHSLETVSLMKGKVQTFTIT